MSGPVRWEHRVYSGNLGELAQVRSDLAADLAGFDPALVADLQLCLSELFANAVKYTDSGTEHGEVVRTLSLSGPTTLRLSISDSGGGGGLPRLPVERDGDEWDWAEGQRGLLLVQNLSRAWDHHPLVPWGDLGANVWGEFAVDPTTVPQGLRPYVFTH
ncbi:ATP-binding protein [Nocardiopsis quinghaiensis]|uniref:ATP-binding protein n=1 Tax=Nocardiopsis quinghaiensis TaxID=464995 RepID=UPI00123A64C9|nr:ATP-binding protein [Nocardiopsis quinghaiensis]